MKKIVLLMVGTSLAWSIAAQVSDPVIREKANGDLGYHLDVYTNVLQELQKNYVDTLNYKNLLKVSLGHMLYSLDPYTQFIPAEDDDYIKRLQSGQYGGVGSVITLCDSMPYFSEPYEGMPAANAGIRPGDKILEIDGVKCKNKSISDVSVMLRGKPETKIKVKVERLGEKKPLVFEFLRKTVKMPTVPYWGKVGDHTGYVMIEDFIDRTSFDFKNAVAELVEKHQIDKLVIDLRNNGGGLVSEAVSIASLFVPRGTTIVTMKGVHDGASRIYKTENDPLYEDMKLIFLVNDNTASSSEILAGALQDLDRAHVIGTRTYGKGVVQQVAELQYDNFMKLTVSKYYLPSGRCVQKYDNVKPKEFKTAKGRKVKDASGIEPDETFSDSSKVNIADYMYVKNVYFKFANQYQATHAGIGKLEDFKVTDDIYNAFCDFVKNMNFTYELESAKHVEELRKFVDGEGYGEMTADIFSQLKEALQPNIERDMRLFADEIKENLERELAMRYYYRWGTYEIFVRHDKTIKKAVTKFDKI